jgi:hypothetical protein
LVGLPVTLAAGYGHLECFVTLLLFGARPGISNLELLRLPAHVSTQCSVPHAITKRG